MTRLTGALIAQYALIHERGKLYGDGGTVKRYIDDISQVVAEIPTKSILDYGCGGGKQYTRDRIHEEWGIEPVLFDPAVPGIDHLPNNTFDGVICTGVLEHIPEAELFKAIGNLVRYADKWCFIVIGVAPSKKTLPDGRPVHVTLMPKDWWRHRLQSAFAARAAKVWLRFEPEDDGMAMKRLRKFRARQARMHEDGGCSQRAREPTGDP